MTHRKYLLSTTINWKWGGCFLIALVALGCEAPSGAHRSASAVAEPKATQQASQIQGNDMPTGIFDERSEGAVKAWQLLTEKGRYRIARTEDFSIPKAAIENEDRRRDIERSIAFAYVGGDINDDGNYKDRAFIVVDMKRSDNARFGLVILNELDDPKSVPEPYWVYREKDLSSTVMTWTRGKVVLIEYHEDGSHSVCRISWDARNQRYSCH